MAKRWFQRLDNSIYVAQDKLMIVLIKGSKETISISLIYVVQHAPLPSSKKVLTKNSRNSFTKGDNLVFRWKCELKKKNSGKITSSSNQSSAECIQSGLDSESNQNGTYQSRVWSYLVFRFQHPIKECIVYCVKSKSYHEISFKQSSFLTFFCNQTYSFTVY